MPPIWQRRGIGYIKISKFALTTDADFRGALTKLKAQGLKKLVLDIRENGGGYLNAATTRLPMSF